MKCVLLCEEMQDEQKEKVEIRRENEKEIIYQGRNYRFTCVCTFFMMGFAFINNGIELISYQNTFTAEIEGIIVSDVTT